MIVRFEYEPLPIHAAFHQNTERERALAGAMGSGKSYAICAEAIAWCLEQPGIRGLITRKTVPALRDTTETVFFDILPHELRQAGEVRRSGGHVESFTFPNGSKVLFRGIDDWQKHKSLNLGFIAWDECDEFDEETYVGMAARVRQRDPTAEAKALGYNGEITRRGMWVAFNPAGHNWLWKRFISPKTKAGNTAWWRSTSFDNPYLTPDYLEYLLSFPEQWVRRYVLCQFDDFAGQIYEDWSWDTHVIEPYKELPLGAPVWMGFDPGTRSESAGLWVVADPKTRCLVGVAEYQDQYLAAFKHALAWRGIEARLKAKPRWRVADPNSITVRDRGSNMSLHTLYARLGFHFDLGPSRHDDRIPMLGTLISLGRFKVTRDCPMTYEAIKDYRWEDLTPAQRAKGADPPERPLKKNDHLVDCAQYLSSRWVRPAKLNQSKLNLTFSQEVQQTIKKQLIQKGRLRMAGNLNGPLQGVVV